jgi:hypothetical protein
MPAEGHRGENHSSRLSGRYRSVRSAAGNQMRDTRLPPFDENRSELCAFSPCIVHKRQGSWMQHGPSAIESEVCAVILVVHALVREQHIHSCHFPSLPQRNFGPRAEIFPLPAASVVRPPDAYARLVSSHLIPLLRLGAPLNCDGHRTDFFDPCARDAAIANSRENSLSCRRGRARRVISRSESIMPTNSTSVCDILLCTTRVLHA